MWFTTDGNIVQESKSTQAIIKKEIKREPEDRQNDETFADENEAAVFVSERPAKRPRLSGQPPVGAEIVEID